MEFGIRGHDHQAFLDGLRDQEPVERIRVNRSKFPDCPDVHILQVEALKVVPRHGLGDEPLRGDFQRELPLGVFDLDFEKA